MKEIEKNKRISKYINMFQPPSSPTYKLDKTEEAGKQIYRCKKSILSVYSDNQKTMEQEDDIIAILKRI